MNAVVFTFLKIMLLQPLHNTMSIKSLLIAFLNIHTVLQSIDNVGCFYYLDLLVLKAWSFE